MGLSGSKGKKRTKSTITPNKENALDGNNTKAALNSNNTNNNTSNHSTGGTALNVSASTNVSGVNGSGSNNSSPQGTPNRSKSSKKGGKSHNQDADGFSRKKLDELYNKYADSENEARIGPDGVSQLLEDIGVKPEDIVVLVFCWHLGAREACYFTKEEFIGGLEKMRIDTVEKITQRLPQFRQELDDENKFRDVYEYAFMFSKESEKKAMNLDMAAAMMELLLGNGRFPFIDEFIEYLQEQKTYKGINRDQWSSMLEFCKTTSEDLANYDYAGSWPCILDEFVIWLREKNPDKYAKLNTGESQDDPYASLYRY